MAPRVSVVIPAFNAERVIGAALASVAGQTFRDFEVIVVDDSSSDRTAALAAAALAGAGAPHRVLRCERNGGPSRTRNVGVRLARGEYVAFLDADDLWLPEKLERQVALMDAHPEVRLCGCQADLIDEDGAFIRPLFKDVPDVQPDGWRRLLWDCYVATPCAMVRRSDLGKTPFDPDLRIAEDRDLWIRLASNGAVAVVQDPLVVIRCSKSSFMSQQSDLIWRQTRPVIHRHLRAYSAMLPTFDRMRAHGKLYSELGKGLCADPQTRLRGSVALLVAAALGYSPWDSLRFGLYNLPGLRHLKEAVKGAREALATRSEAWRTPAHQRRPRGAGR